jgi:hypothetical protein
MSDYGNGRLRRDPLHFAMNVAVEHDISYHQDLELREPALK